MPDYLPTLAEAPVAAVIPGAEERKQRERIAAALLMQGSSNEPIGHWTQGLNRVAQGLIGGYQLGELRRQAAGEEARTQAILAGLPGLQGAGTPSAAMPQRAAETTTPPAATPAAPDPATLPTIAERFAGEPPQTAAPAAPAVRPQLLAAIKGFEGYSPTAYADYKQHSVGYGTRATSPGERITPDVAEARLSEEVGKAAAIVDKFKPDLPPGVRDALVSLTYNAGDSWTKSGLGQAVQKGDYGAAQQIFQQYNRAGGQVLPGLVSRRQQEAQMFNREGAPAAAPPGLASRADVIPPAIQAEIQLGQALARNAPTRAAGLQMYRAALEKAQAWQASQLPAVRDVDPDKPPMVYDPRTQTFSPAKGIGGAATTIMGPDNKPIAVDPSWNTKEARKDITSAAVKSALPADDKEASALRKEIQDIPSYKNYSQAMPIMKSMVKSAGMDTRAADVDFIYGLGKIMDPTSVVRDKEQVMAQGVAALPERLQALVKSQLAGEGALRPETRAQIIEVARNRATSYQDIFNQDMVMFRKIAADRRFNPAHVIPDFGEIPTYSAPKKATQADIDAAEAELARRRGAR